MEKPRLTYFDAPASRGEECRIALHLAGVDFEDVRVKPSDWPAKKSSTPFGSMPLLELPGKPVLAQSIAILTLIGRRHGLHPQDDFEAARHEAIMHYGEELRTKVSPTLRMSEPEKKTAREGLAATDIPAWAANIEKQIGDGPFFGGATLNVADIKLYMLVRWFKTSGVDHVPKTVFDRFPKLTRLHDAFADDPRIKAWYAKR
jgi:prostaglandin-H2 D-isomerase / glutathione transferase